MTSDTNGERLGEVEEANGEIALQNSTSRKTLLDKESARKGKHKKIASIIPNKLKIPKISTNSTSVSPFRQIAKDRDEISSSPTKRGFKFLMQKIEWGSLWEKSLIWIKNPFNIALLLWISCVNVSGALLFLIMTGMLNSLIPNESDRNVWYEVNNQILNVLFTLMCLYMHPNRFYHLVLLCRWKKPEDVSILRKNFCKNGTYKPHERAHMMVVVILLHVNCFGQYALCGLNLAYKRSDRPGLGVGFCLFVAIAGAAIAGLYSRFSPLGKDYDYKFDVEAQDQTRNGKIVENAPAWNGGIFDFSENVHMTYSSLFCTFCVFGWNMERLGFGNKYVHIATFFLFCTAPFCILNLAAAVIDNEIIREVFGLTGIIVSVFGLLYGGFWRIQLREKFNLPENDACCGKPAVADCSQWLFCCWCSLAQEVRTADYYDIGEDKFRRKESTYDRNPGDIRLFALPRENGAVHSQSTSELLRSTVNTDVQMKPPFTAKMCGERLK